MFWSSSPMSDNDSSAWGVNFLSGDVGMVPISGSNYIRCVRGEM